MTDETSVSIRLTELFIASGSDLDVRYGGKCNTAMMRAAKEGLASSLLLLMEAGASRGVRDCRGSLPLTAAALGRRYRCIELLAAHASDTDMTEAIIAACKQSYPTSLEVLLAAARNVQVINARDAQGDTPLTIATRYSSRCMEMLLNRGADVNGTNASGWTPLAILARYGHFISAKGMLAHPDIDMNPVVDAGRAMLRTRPPAAAWRAWHTHGRGWKATTPLMIAAVTGSSIFLDILWHDDVDTLMTTTGDAFGRLVEEIAPPYMRRTILEARRTQTYRSRRGKMAALRIARFLRDTTCNPVYAAARRSIERCYEA